MNETERTTTTPDRAQYIETVRELEAEGKVTIAEGGVVEIVSHEYADVIAIMKQLDAARRPEAGWRWPTRAERAQTDRWFDEIIDRLNALYPPPSGSEEDH